MSLKLKSRTEMPPDGLIIEIPQLGMTKAKNTHRQYWSATEAIQAFRAIAEKNPRFGLPTDDEKIWSYISQQNAIRVSNIAGAEMYLKREGGQAQAIKKSIPDRLKAVAEAVRKLNSGRSLLAEWRSEGFSPVPKDEANKRATICVDCPKNGDGGLEKYFTVPASESIRKEIEEMKQANLTTELDEKLGTCSGCLCPLRLKIHTPMTLILKHMLPETKADLDARCWILKA